MSITHPVDGQSPGALAVELPTILEPIEFDLPPVHVSENMRRILVALLTEITWLADLAPTDLEDPSVANVLRVGIPYRPVRWFGGPLNCARRKAYSRAIKRLEWAGLVSCIMQRSRDRVAYVQLNAVGLQQAIELAGPDADPNAIVEGLRRTSWGDYLAANVPVGDAPVEDADWGVGWEKSLEQAMREWNQRQ